MKKGFTLIELLAVIVILSIISLIVTPVISKVIDDAKKNASLRSVEGYINAVETSSIKSLFNQSEFNSTGTYTLEELNEKINYKGNGPTEGWVKIENNKVVDYSVKQDDRIINYDVLSFSPEESITNELRPFGGIVYEIYELKRIIYFDPVSNNECNSDKYTGNNTCYKWRVIETNDKNYKNTIILQLDHNIINTTIWSNSTNSVGPINALTELNKLTESWTKIPNLNYEYNTTQSKNNYGILKCIDGICKIGDLEIPKISKARMITGEEVQKIANTVVEKENTISKNWSLASTASDYFFFSNSSYELGQNSAGSGDKTLSWMIENTCKLDSSGSTTLTNGASNYGYYTLSPVSENDTYIWNVGYDGRLGNNQATLTNYYGIRPVITIPKTLLK